MSQEQIVTIFQQALYTILELSLPILLIGLIVGLIISIMQATTQINEQTLVVVAKIVATMLSLIFFGPFMLQTLREFFMSMYDYMLALIR